LVLAALLGANRGQGVVWYTGILRLFFLLITLKLDFSILCVDRHLAADLARRCSSSSAG